MLSLSDIARSHTDLEPHDVARLHLLLGEWQLLADLSFADLILWLRRRDDDGFVAAAQIRPVTGQTAYVEDVVGQTIPAGRRPLLDDAWSRERICRDGDPEWWESLPVREEAIPVRYDDRVIAVIGRSTNLAAVRTPSRLELTYLRSAGDLAQMVAEGRFPFSAPRADSDASPRAGDGLIRLDAEGNVVYASPNAVSAYRRLGLTGDVLGVHLGTTTAELAPDTGPVDEALSSVVSGRLPREAEIDANDTVVRLRAIPLTPGGSRVGALVLLRDVTDLRRRDRELLSKDATIREIHHRVKNNLQTVAALLRLQTRRIESPAGRSALEEAVRRVRSIAMVHETLSHATDGVADFDEIADRLMAMVGDLTATEAGVSYERVGSFGSLPGAVATPLAMALAELLQNAVEHGFRGGGGRLELRARRDGDQVDVSVVDDGAGLPPTFDPEASSHLGLHIVKALVEGELGGTLELTTPAGAAGGPENGDQPRPGTRARLIVRFTEAR